VKRKTPQRPADSAGDTSLTATDGAAPESQDAGEPRAVRRRALLTRGGAVVAGAVGAGVAVAAAAAPASAAPGDPVLQGQANAVGTNVPATEIQAISNNASAPTPTVVVTNTGSPAAGEASPPLRITPAASGLDSPAANTAGGDMVATNDGNLWFTHAVPNVGTFPAAVHTDANSNSFAPLAGPYRILDTRTSAGRSHVLDPTGKFDSTGRLLAGKIIHIDLSLLVTFGDAVTSNLTVTKPASGGYLTLWSGAGATRPTASSINFVAGQTIANLTVSGIAAYSSTKTDTIAIYASVTTHVILDVAGFNVGYFAQVNPAYAAASMRTATRAQRISQALAQR
jgi:hypothetical protein